MLVRLSLLALVATSIVALSAAADPTSAVCPSLPVQLQLHSSPSAASTYQLVFSAVDHADEATNFIDIHYRINNDDATNLRVATNGVITTKNLNAKQALVDGITLQPGDALRAYATYSTRGFACDTPIHTFNAPAPESREEMQTAHAMRQQAAFETQAAVRQNALNAATCPTIALDQDVFKVIGARDTYALVFENRNPLQQLHYVDLHLSTDAARGFENIRLASDMQLHMAHKVVMPAVVIKPTEELNYFYSYRTTDNAGKIIDCTTEVMSVQAKDVTHEVDVNQIREAAAASAQ